MFQHSAVLMTMAPIKMNPMGTMPTDKSVDDDGHNLVMVLLLMLHGDGNGNDEGDSGFDGGDNGSASCGGRLLEVGIPCSLM